MFMICLTTGPHASFGGKSTGYENPYFCIFFLYFFLCVFLVFFPYVKDYKDPQISNWVVTFASSSLYLLGSEVLTVGYVMYMP